MPVFDRWTGRSLRAITLAQGHARTANHDEVGTGHILLGLLEEGGGVAYLALTALGADPGSLRDALDKRLPRSSEPVTGHLPFSTRGKKVCELAAREAVQLGCSYVGTEHVLIGLIREGEGTGAHILVALGLHPGLVEAKVLELLGTFEKAEAARRVRYEPRLAAHAAGGSAFKFARAHPDDGLELHELLAAVKTIDAFLDSHRSPEYIGQPLANDWARITKVCEEAGEVWKVLSQLTGENYRKGICATEDDLLGELGDCVSAAMCAIQHRTKDIAATWAVVSAAFRKASQRVAEHLGEVPAE